MKIIIFLGLIALDYISGICAAYVKKTLSSKIGLKGLIKKGGICLGFIACYLVEAFLGEMGYTDISFISTTYLILYGCNEFISIFENLDEIGIKLPEKIKSVINKIKGDKNE